jgi:hypothetical protein
VPRLWSMAGACTGEAVRASLPRSGLLELGTRSDTLNTLNGTRSDTLDDTLETPWRSDTLEVCLKRPDEPDGSGGRGC